MSNEPKAVELKPIHALLLYNHSENTKASGETMKAFKAYGNAVEAMEGFKNDGEIMSFAKDTDAVFVPLQPKHRSLLWDSVKAVLTGERTRAMERNIGDIATALGKRGDFDELIADTEPDDGEDADT